MAEDLDYVPLPDSVEALIRQQWAKITDAAGKPVCLQVRRGSRRGSVGSRLREPCRATGQPAPASGKGTPMDATLVPVNDDPRIAGHADARAAARPPGGHDWRSWSSRWLTRTAAALTLLLLFGIIVSLFIGAWPSIRDFGLKFLWTAEWDPVQEKFGGLVMIYGTLATSAIALLIAVPVSFGIALFLTELSPKWLKRPLGTAIELLAAIPSIVYGMWGLMVFSPMLATYVQQPLQKAFGERSGAGGTRFPARRSASASCRRGSSSRS